jgi:hypothetical protein
MENWEERFKGLQRRYDSDRKSWESERDALTSKVDSIMEKMSTLSQPQEPQPPAQPQGKQGTPAPEKNGKESGATTTVEALDQALALRKATQYRDTLLEEYTQEGAEGEGLPLAAFRDKIEVKMPGINPDGTLDDKAQRAEIEFFIKALKGVKVDTRKQTQQQMLEGQTPGSATARKAPEASENGDQKLLDEYHELLEKMPMAETDQEYTEMERRLMELGDNPIIARTHGGRTRPGMNHEQQQDAIRQLQEQMSQLLEGQGKIVI